VITAYSLFFAYDELAFSTEIYGCSFSIFMIIDIAFICNVNFEALCVLQVKHEIML